MGKYCAADKFSADLVFCLNSQVNDFKRRPTWFLNYSATNVTEP